MFFDRRREITRRISEAVGLCRNRTACTETSLWEQQSHRCYSCWMKAAGSLTLPENAKAGVVLNSLFSWSEVTVCCFVFWVAIVYYWFFLLGINFCNFQEVGIHMQVKQRTACRDVKHGNFIGLFWARFYITFERWKNFAGPFDARAFFFADREKTAKIRNHKKFRATRYHCFKSPFDKLDTSRVSCDSLKELNQLLKRSPPCFHSFSHHYLNIVTLTFLITNSSISLFALLTF